MGRLNVTHTFVVLEVPAAVYELVKAKLLAGGYAEALLDLGDGGEVIDMQGIALASEEPG
jgi:hypothetical protein